MAIPRCGYRILYWWTSYEPSHFTLHTMKRTVLYFSIGILFGIIMIKSEAASWFRIYEMFQFKSFHMYGIIGAAYATLFVIVFINLLKIILVQYRFKINPYGRETLPTISIVVLLYFLISSISIDYDPFTVMIFRSTFIGITFILLAYLLKLTDDIQQFLAKIFPFVKRD
mgnify:CR=1 FL=1